MEIGEPRRAPDARAERADRDLVGREAVRDAIGGGRVELAPAARAERFAGELAERAEGERRAIGGALARRAGAVVEDGLVASQTRRARRGVDRADVAAAA